MKIFQAVLLVSEWDAQESFLKATVCHPAVIKFPIKWSYQIQFLKKLAEELDKATPEVHDHLYEMLVVLQEKEKSCPQEWVYKHYLVKDELITIKESPQLISDGTTGLRSWPAGLFLADWCTATTEITDRFKGKKVLELGSGTGVTGIIVNKICRPRNYFLSDCHDLVLQLLRENVHLNGCQENVVVLNLNWERPQPSSVEPDFILAADVVYDDTIFEPLLNVLKLLCRSTNLQLFLACTIRNEKTLTDFLTLVEANGFNHRLIVTSKDLENRLYWEELTEIRLYCIEKKSER